MARLLNLINKAKKGNSDAFFTLFQQCEKEIYRTAFLYVKNQSDALDIVQETAYRSFKSIKNLKEPKYFRTWIIKIAISCAIDLLRKQKNVIQLHPEAIEIEISTSKEDDIDLEITVRDLIEFLNEVEKSVIILRFYEGLTIKEVSQTINVPLGTTKTILYRALGKLRGKLKGDDVYEK